MRRVRVVLLVDRIDDNAAGAERLVVGLATHLPRDRFDVRVCATRAAGGGMLAELAAAGVPCLALDRRFRLDVPRFRPLIRALRRDGCDVLHAHMFGSNVWGCVLGRACGVPVVLAHEHTWSFQGRPLRRLLDGRVVARLATRFLAVSELDRRRMVTVEGVPATKALVMPNAYIPRRCGQTADLRRELGLPSAAPVVGTIASMRPQKALDVLLDAFVRIRARHRDATLVLAGDGPCRAGLERRATRLGIATATRFLGRREDADSILRALDVGAMSSDFEGTPLFALECMANDVPLVATAVGGIPALTGDAAVLVAPRDPQALADAVCGLLDDPRRRTRLARAGRRRAEPLHIDAVAARYGDLYERLLADRGVSRS